MTYQKCREVCIIGNVMSRICFLFKKLAQREELIQVNLMAHVREEFRLNHRGIPIWLHNLQIYEIFLQYNHFSISDLPLLAQTLNIFNYKVFRRVPYYLSLYIYCLFIFNKWIIVLALCCLLFFTLFHLLCVLYPAQEGIFQ